MRIKGIREIANWREGLMKTKTPCEGGPPGVLYGCENKGVARRGVCKWLKTKVPWGEHRVSICKFLILNEA